MRRTIKLSGNKILTFNTLYLADLANMTSGPTSHMSYPAIMQAKEMDTGVPHKGLDPQGTTWGRINPRQTVSS